MTKPKRNICQKNGYKTKTEMRIHIRIDDESKMMSYSNMRRLSEKAQKALSTIIKDTPKNAEISIRLTDNNTIHHLNNTYRQCNKPTNVLSFHNPQTHSIEHPDAPHLLGDIILAYPVICNEARQYDKSIENHMTHLMIHGILHLLGYTHKQEKEACKMEHIEIAALKTLNIDNPYTPHNKLRDYTQ